MDFSEDEKNEIMNKHNERIQKDGSKKYIVTIYNEYVPLLDSMSIEERNDTINDIISVHYDNTNEKKQKRKIFKIITSIVIAFLILIFIAPLSLWLINYSFTTTQNNYTEMQNNFKVLYKKK